jgi:GT2 family glycosyltransferase
MAGMLKQSRAYTRAHAGKLFGLDTTALFCAAIPRRTYEKVGPLDEAFGTGYFEDDDYCRRIERAGLRVMCAEDAFVHHHLSASFNRLQADRRKELFERNRLIYERKWGAWKPHRPRPV